MYKDFTDAGHSGLQHVAYWTSDYDADLARLQAQGFKPVMSGEVGERGRFVYFDTHYHPGTVIELSEVAGPKGKMFDLIREMFAKTNYGQNLLRLARESEDELALR